MTLRLLLGVLLLAAYALPPFLPPPAHPPVPVTDATPLLARVFPGVPPLWVAARLLALLAGAALMASLVRVPPFRTSLAAAGAALPAWPAPTARRIALAAAALHAACLPWVGRLPDAAQLLYLVWLAVPALVLAAASRGMPGGSPREPRLGAALPPGVLAVVAVWFVARLAVSWHDPRAAVLVDMWRNFSTMERLVADAGNVLVGSIGPGLPGTNALSFVLQGLPVLRALNLAPTFEWLQVANACWLALSGVATGMIAAVMLGPGAAAVATAALLFSPFVLLGPLMPMPLFDGPLFVAVPLLLLVRFLRRGSAAALVLLGPAAGLAATRPALVPVTGVLLLVAAWQAWRRRVPAAIAAAAVLSLLAAVLPSVPGPETLRAMMSVYVATEGQYDVLEETVMGQRPTASGARAGWLEGRPPGPFDVPLGALLSPFASARTAMRLRGDVAYDPIGAALAATGLLVCLRFASRHGLAALLPVLLAAALLTGFVSSGDRPSLVRTFGAFVPLALLAGAGFAAVRDLLRDTRGLAAATAVAIAVGGTVLFDVVNPRLVRWSSLALAVAAVDEADLERAAVVNDMRTFATWLGLHEITTQVPARPLAVVEPPDGDTPPRDVLFWSPAVEEVSGLRAALCRRWSDATTFTIADPAGLSHVHAAHLAGPAWQPALPEAQWRSEPCRPGATAQARAARSGASPDAAVPSTGSDSMLPSSRIASGSPVGRGRNASPR